MIFFNPSYKLIDSFLLIANPFFLPARVEFYLKITLMVVLLFEEKHKPLPLRPFHFCTVQFQLKVDLFSHVIIKLFKDKQ